MAIDAISQTTPPVPPPTTAPAETEPVQPTAEVPAVEPPPEPAVEEESGDKAAGVLRKLQEGHFKGVADATAAEPESLDGDALIGGLQEAFDTLIVALEPLLTPPPPEEPAPPEEPVEPAEPLPDPLQALRDAFEAALADVTEALNTESLLPPISLPMGNGVAYEKFMAIYNELQAPDETEPDPPAEPTDTTV